MRLTTPQPEQDKYPLRDVPQSIQVVPEQVLEDQQVTRLEEALRNVSRIRTDDTFNDKPD